MHLGTVLQFNNHFIVFIWKIINNYWFQFALLFNVRLNMTLKVSFHSAQFQFISHLSTFSVLCCFFSLFSSCVSNVSKFKRNNFWLRALSVNNYNLSDCFRCSFTCSNVIHYANRMNCDEISLHIRKWGKENNNITIGLW